MTFSTGVKGPLILRVRAPIAKRAESRVAVDGGYEMVTGLVGEG